MRLWVGLLVLLAIASGVVVTRWVDVRQRTPATASSSRKSLTLQDARTLPPQELAARALGEAGSNVVDVWRPWPEEKTLSALQFFGRARDAGFPGLCETDLTQVDFGDDGQTYFENGARVASLSHAYRFNEDFGVADWSKDDFETTMAKARQQDRKCARLGDVKAFFQIRPEDPVLGASQAYRAGSVVLAMRDLGSLPEPLPKVLKCMVGETPCENTRAILSSFQPGSIRDALRHDSGDGCLYLAECYSLILSGPAPDKVWSVDVSVRLQGMDRQGRVRGRFFKLSINEDHILKNSSQTHGPPFL